ncbi:MAG: type II secretion system GspH family protein [Candidatus Riflebacteria bacterium]|nr:type II secretion system GspH family protein [Candidatus Riflebacteria bacterium]
MDEASVSFVSAEELEHFRKNQSVALRRQDSGCQALGRRSGITLVELVIGIVIISLLFVVVMNIFGAGLRGSNKGMAHLTIMEGAAILLSQIEYDLLRASVLLDPAVGTADKVARWEMLVDDAAGKGTIIYNLLDNGIERSLDVAGDQHKYVYCRGLKVGLQFHHVCMPDPENSAQRVGMWVELSVTAPEKFGTTEKFSMKRLIICKNIINPL